MAVVFSNNATTALASSVTSSATSITVQDGSVFPTLSGSDYTYITLEDLAGNVEIVKLTARSVNVLTIVRAQDGTSARAFGIASKCELRLTAALLNEVAAQADTDTNTTYTAGSGLALTGTVFSNTSPDRTVALTGAGATSISGTYPNFTITSTDTNTVYTHPSSHPISFITGLQAALDGKVDDSQVLTNVPAGALFTDTVYTLPFADNSANWNTAYSWGNHASQSYATQSYVGTAISNLVDSSPATLDTLNELAAALGDDPNFATTVTNSIATKLPLAGGTLTGTLAMGANAITSTGTISSGVITTTGIQLLADAASNANDASLYLRRSNNNDWGLFVKGTSTATDYGIKVDLNGTHSYAFRGMNNNAEYFRVGTDMLLHNAQIRGGSFNVGTQEVITSGRNLTNIGTLNGGTPWTSANDGSGSGLDADLLDGQHGSYYAPNSSLGNYLPLTGGTLTGNLFSNSIISTSEYMSSSNHYNTGSYHILNNAQNGWHTVISRNNGYDYTVNALGGYQINGTTVIDSTRNLTNIGTISSGAITSTGLTVSTTGEVYVATIENLGVAGDKHGLWVKSDSSWSSSNLLRITSGTNDLDAFIVAPDRVYIAPNVGIGDLAPAEKLTVSGNIRASGSYLVGGTTVIDSSRNLTNIGTISSGAISVNGLDQSIIASHSAGAGAWGSRIVSKNPTYNVASFLGNYNGYAGVFAHSAALDAWAPIYINAHSGSGHANVYTGSLYVNGNNLAWHAGNDGSGSGLDADLLDGIDSSGFVRQLADSSTGANYNDPSSRRVNPDTGNPTNEHYAVSTFGNGSNVTGQLATHFVSGETYTRGYNSVWSAWRTQWDSLNDGSGSGLDADLLDGQHASSFLGASATASEAYYLDIKDTRAGQYAPSDVPDFQVSAEFTNAIVSGWHSVLNLKGWHDGYATWQLIGGSDQSAHNNLYFRSGVGSTWGSLNTVWHSGNDGSGSGLDADLLDGQHGSYYAPASHVHSYLPLTGGNLSGTLTFSQPVGLGFANGQYIKDNGGGGLVIYSGNHINLNHTAGLTSNGGTVWASNNDGSGSGLDADLLDGVSWENAPSIKSTGLISADNRQVMAVAHWSAVGASTGAIVIELPGTIGNYSMPVIEITTYEYTGVGHTTYTISGHNWQTASFWYNSKCTVVGAAGKGIYLGYNSNTNRHCIQIGLASTGWGYGAVTVAVKHHPSYYDSAQDMAGSWNIFQTTNLAGINTGSVSTDVVWHSNNDGSGSGLDADLLDGIDSSSFLRSDATDSFTGSNLFFPSLTLNISNDNSAGSGANTYFRGNNTHFVLGLTSGNTLYMNYGNAAGSFNLSGNVTHNGSNSGTLLWGNSNDGSGSGLDADLLDGAHKVDIQKELVNVTSPAVTVADSCLPSTGYGFKHFLGLGPSNNDGHILGMTWTNTASYGAQIFVDTDPTNTMAFRSRGSTGDWTSWNTVWHTANDGSGSGLDADLLDGIDSSGFVKARGRTNWNDSTVLNNVIGMLGWKNYGNSHVIFDASASLSPEGTGVNANDAANAWTSSYPTLMGWNGATTYGVRVDSARVANTASNAELLDGIDSTSFLRSDAVDTIGARLTMGLQHAIVPADFGIGVSGLYDPARYQHVWSMGPAYGTSSDGTSYGNMYGLTWTHTNIGTGANQSIAGLSHQLQLRENGLLKCAFGTGIWTAHNITSGGQGTLWGSSNDGSGSGLDADLLDGIDSTYFNRGDQGYGVMVGTSGWNMNDLFTNRNRAGFFDVWSGSNFPPSTSHVHGMQVRHNSSAHYGWQLAGQYGQNNLWHRQVSNGSWGSWNQQWGSGNDGSGSGLDADSVDGYDSLRLTKVTGGTVAGDWNTIFNTASAGTSAIYEVINIYGGSHSNQPSGLYSYGGVLAWRLDSHTFKLYSSHLGDLAFQSGWGNDGYSGWRNILHSANIGSYAWTSSNDGSGSGLDADLLDGIQSSGFHTVTSDPSTPGNGTISIGNNGSYTYVQSHAGQPLYLNPYGNPLKANGGGDIWHAGNDGSGSGLDADLLDGYNTSTSATGNTVVVREGSGHIYGNYILGSYFNASAGNSENPTIGQIWTQSTGDNYLRKSTPAHLISQLGLLTTTGKAADSELLDGIDSSAIVYGANGYGTTNLMFTSMTNQKSGFYDNYNSGTPTATWYSLVNMAHYGSNHGHQIAGSFYSAGDLYNRNNNNTGLSAWAKIWNTANDGSGSGLDADLLDGINSTSFLRSDADDTASGIITFSNGSNATSTATGAVRITGGLGVGYNVYANAFLRQGNTVWDAGNDGSGSGLDADLLDGYNSDNFLGKFGNGYYQAPTWIQLTGAWGLYAPTVNNAHFFPNADSSYGTWRMVGSRNGYSGISLSVGNVNIGMYDGSGNGGDWSPDATGNWHYYYHRANRCMGVSGSTTSSSYGLYEQGGGIYSTGNITAYSDRRVKENIRTIDNALETVEQMRGVYYNRIDDEEKKTVIGFIAQEVDEVEGAKPLVTYAADVDQYGVSYGNATALLVEAIKELSQQVKDLQKEIKELKNA